MLYTLKQLSRQYSLQAQLLHARLRMVREEATRMEDPMEAYLLRRRVDILRAMWRDTRDTADLLAHYYDGRCPEPSGGTWTVEE